MQKIVEFKPKKLPVFSGKREGGEGGFFRQEYEDYFWSCFGGEQHVREHYPLVYQAYQRSKADAAGRKGSLKEEQDPDMLPIQVAARPIGYHTSSLTRGGAGGLEDEITSEGYLHTKKRLPYVSIIANLYEKETKQEIDSYALYAEHTSAGDEVSKNLRASFEDIQRRTDRILVSHVDCCYITEDGKMVTEPAESGTFICEGFASVVKSFELVHPCDKSQKKNDPLIVLYGRDEQEGETADYKYPECKETDKKVPINFPLEGEIIFSDAHFPVGYAKGTHTANIEFGFSDNGTVLYKQSIENCFSVDGTDEHKLKFKFPEDWLAKLDVSDFSVKTSLNLRASFYVRYAIGSKTSENLRDIPIEISSSQKSYGEYFSAEGTHVYIPYVSVRWGCFAKDTWLRMGDGSRKRICDIKAGDSLYSPSGGNVKVTGMVSGEEEKLAVIETEEGSRIRVSRTQPMITAQGLRQAADIRPGTMLVNERGDLETVKFAYLCEYNDITYNVETGGKDIILIGNGLRTGGYEMQNAAEAEKREEEPEPWKPEVQALVEEMKRMMEDTFS